MADYVNIPMSVAVDTVALTTTVAGNLIIGGEVPVLQSKTVYPSASDQAIEPDTGYDALEDVTVKAVVIENLSAANIVDGVTVKVGDADDDDRIASVTGTAQTGIVPTGTLEITTNGTENCSAYEYVDVDVANSYSAGDEGKVVRSGALVSQTSATYTQNSTYDTTTVNSVTVQVEGGGSATLGTKSVTANGTYKAEDDSLDGYSQVTVSVPASAVDTGTKSITANGNNQDVVGYAAVNVNVPNTYSAGDEGKVVSSGALVAQTAHADVTPTTSDQTIDTTTNNSIKVKGDADLVAGNIKKDVEIFGVTGSYEGGGGGITVDDIAQNIEPSGAVVLSNNVTQIAQRAFVNKPITSISGNEITEIKNEAFNYCTNLTTVSFPNCTDLGDVGSTIQNRYLFNGCTKLQNFNLRAVQRLNGGYQFAGIGSSNYPAIVVLPNISGVLASGGSVFRASYFAAVDFGGGITKIPNDTFYQGTFQVVILRKNDAIVIANNKDSISRLTTAAGSTIYIPKVLYDHLGDGTALDYQAATNWSQAARTFAQIEGSQYENYYADGTAIPT